MLTHQVWVPVLLAHRLNVAVLSAYVALCNIKTEFKRLVNDNKLIKDQNDLYHQCLSWQGKSVNSVSMYLSLAILGRLAVYSRDYYCPPNPHHPI